MLRRQGTAGKQSPISPLLFMTPEGEPMRFFLRPGPTKQQLQPQIKAGGGLVTKAQEPGAILLADPEEFESLPKNVSHWYVSTKYIQDCVEKNEQLEVEDYRLNPEIQGPATRQKASRHSSGGRLPYTPEEDAAILDYATKHKDKIGGNQLWQEMEKNKVTGHTWQSMKSRYQKCLAGRKMSPEQKGTNEAETKTDQTSSRSSQSESEEMNVTSAPKPELILDDSSPAQSAPGKKQAASPTPTQPLRRSSRRQLELDELPLPQTSKRSSLPPSSQKTTVSPPPSKKPKLPPPKETSTPQKDTSTDQDAVQNGTSTDQPSPKRDRCQASASGQQAGGKKRRRKLGILEMASKEFESSDDETTDASVNEEVQDRPNPGLGPTLQEKSQPPETACPGAVTSEPPTSTSKAHLFIFDSESQEGRSQSVVDNNTGTSSCPQQRKKDAVASLTQTQLDEDIQRIRGLMKQTNQDLQSVTKALLQASGDFSVARSLLLTPSSSSVLGPVWTRSEDNFLRSGDPVVRERLQDKYGEEAVAKRLLFLEELRSLTKSLLKASEDLAVAWSLLLTPSSVLGPFWSRWTCFDDNFLRSGDLVVRERLQDKFGEEAVAKRLRFLEVE